jgi:hypothetical protein
VSYEKPGDCNPSKWSDRETPAFSQLNDPCRARHTIQDLPVCTLVPGSVESFESALPHTPVAKVQSFPGIKHPVVIMDSPERDHAIRIATVEFATTGPAQYEVCILGLDQIRIKQQGIMQGFTFENKAVQVNVSAFRSYQFAE